MKYILLLIFVMTNIITANSTKYYYNSIDKNNINKNLAGKKCFTISNLIKVKWNIKNKKWEKQVKIYYLKNNKFEKINEYKLYFISKTNINDKYYNQYDFVKGDCIELSENLKNLELLSNTQYNLAMKINTTIPNETNKQYSYNYTLRNVLARKIEDIRN
jgi:hypothetical protein